MTAKKVFFGMLIAVSVLILIGGIGFYFGHGMLDQRSKKISDLITEEQILQEQITLFEQAKKKVEELSFVNGLAAEVLPSQKEQARAVAELRKFAAESDLNIQQLTFSGTTDPKVAPELSQTSTVPGLTGIRALPATITFRSGLTYQDFLRFLEKIETNRRRMQVTSTTLTPDPGDRSNLVNATIAINIYLKG